MRKFKITKYSMSLMKSVGFGFFFLIYKIIFPLTADFGGDYCSYLLAVYKRSFMLNTPRSTLGLLSLVHLKHVSNPTVTIET